MVQKAFKMSIKPGKYDSRYVAQNAAIWLADEVLRYIVIMTLRGAKTIFLDTWLRNNPKDVTLTMVRVLLRETASLLTFIMNVLIL